MALIEPAAFDDSAYSKECGFVSNLYLPTTVWVRILLHGAVGNAGKALPVIWERIPPPNVLGAVDYGAMASCPYAHNVGVAGDA